MNTPSTRRLIHSGAARCCNLATRTYGWTCGCACGLLAASMCLAQDANAPTPPLPPPLSNKFDDAPVIMMYLGLAIILAAVIAAGMIPSKRGHQD